MYKLKSRKDIATKIINFIKKNKKKIEIEYKNIFLLISRRNQNSVKIIIIDKYKNYQNSLEGGIDLENGNAYIHNINKRALNKKFYNKYINNNNLIEYIKVSKGEKNKVNYTFDSKTIIIFFIDIIKLLKNVLNINYIELEDNSFIYCKGERISSLADFGFLKNMNTWYRQHFGFEFRNNTDKNKFKYNKIIYKNIKIKHLLKKINEYNENNKSTCTDLLINKIKEYNENFNIEKNKNQHISVLFQNIKYTKKQCIFLKNNIHLIFKCLGLHHLINIKYILYI